MLVLVTTACAQVAQKPLTTLEEAKFLNESGQVLQSHELTQEFTIQIPMPSKSQTVEILLEQEGKATQLEADWQEEDGYMNHRVTIKEEGSYRFILRTLEQAELVKEEASINFQVHDIESLMKWEKQEEGQYHKEGVTLLFQRIEPIEMNVYLVHEQTRVKLNLTWQDEQAKAFFDQEGTWHLEAELMIDDITMRTSFKDSFTIDHTSPELSILHEQKDIASLKQAMFNEPVTLQMIVKDTNLDVTSLHVSINGISQELIWKQDLDTYQVEVTLAQVGLHSITIYARDLAGNEIERRDDILLDMTSPEISLFQNHQSVSSLPAYLNHEAILEVRIKDLSFDPKKSVITDQDEKQTIAWIKKEDYWSQTMTLTEGDHQLTIIAYDAVNHTSTKQYKTCVDTKSPLVKLQYSSSEFYQNGMLLDVDIEDANIEWSDQWISIKKDGVEIHPDFIWKKHEKGGSLQSYIKEEGSYSLRFHVQDMAGNDAVYLKDDERLDTYAYDFHIDHTPPKVKLESSITKDIDHYATTQTMRIQIEEKHITEELLDLRILKDQKDFNQELVWHKENDLMFTELAFTEDGHYELAFEARDQAGNKASYTIYDQNYNTLPKLSFVIDQNQPLITLTKDKDGTYFHEDLSLKYQVEEINPVMSEISIYCDHQLIKQFIFHDTDAHELHFDAKEEGEYQVVLEAKDRAGNVARKELNFVMDQTAPEITTYFNGFPARLSQAFISNQNVDIQVTWHDRFLKDYDITLTKDQKEIPVDVQADGGNISLYKETASENLYELQVHTTDLAGNERNMIYHIRIDTFLPQLEFEEDPFQGKPRNTSWTPRLKGEMQDFHVYEASLYRNQMLEREYRWGDAISKEGSYVLALSVRDEALNEATFLPPYTFVIDQTAPHILIEEDRKREELLDQTVSLSTKLRLYVTDEVTLHPIIKVLSLNEQPITKEQQRIDEDGTPYYLIEFSQAGTSTLFVQAYDEAGNETKESVSFQVLETLKQEEVKTIPKPLQAIQKEENPSLSFGIWAGLGCSVVVFLAVVIRYVK